MESKVLIVSYGYPPLNDPGSQRPFYLSKYLTKIGAKNYVLTPLEKFSSNGNTEFKDFTDKNIIYTNNINLSKLNQSLIDKNDIKIKTSKIKRIFKSLVIYLLETITVPDKIFTWIPYATKAGKLFLKNNDINILFSTSPYFTNHLVAYLIKGNRKWVVDIRDGHYIHNKERSNFYLRKGIDRILEKFVLKKADHITFVTNTLRKDFIERYNFIEAKSTSIYNGYDEEEFLIENIEKTKKLTLFYAGNFYGGLRDPFDLLIPLEKMLKDKEISLEDICINIAGKIDGNTYRKIIDLEISKSINWLGILDRSSVLKKMRESDVLWLIELPHGNFSVPIKLLEYLGAGKFILGYAPSFSEIEHLIVNTNLGKLIDNTKPKGEVYSETKKIVLELLELYRKNKSISVSVNETQLDMYKRSFQGKQFSELFTQLLS